MNLFPGNLFLSNRWQKIIYLNMKKCIGEKQFFNL